MPGNHRLVDRLTGKEDKDREKDISSNNRITPVVMKMKKTKMRNILKEMSTVVMKKKSTIKETELEDRHSLRHAKVKVKGPRATNSSSRGTGLMDMARDIVRFKTYLIKNYSKWDLHYFFNYL